MGKGHPRSGYQGKLIPHFCRAESQEVKTLPACCMSTIGVMAARNRGPVEGFASWHRGAARNRGTSQFRRLGRDAGCEIIARWRTSSADLHRPWRANNIETRSRLSAGKQKAKPPACRASDADGPHRSQRTRLSALRPGRRTVPATNFVPSVFGDAKMTTALLNRPAITAISSKARADG
jgi:hypothetical protein